MQACEERVVFDLGEVKFHASRKIVCKHILRKEEGKDNNRPFPLVFFSIVQTPRKDLTNSPHGKTPRKDPKKGRPQETLDTHNPLLPFFNRK